MHDLATSMSALHMLQGKWKVALTLTLKGSWLVSILWDCGGKLQGQQQR